MSLLTTGNLISLIPAGSPCRTARTGEVIPVKALLPTLKTVAVQLASSSCHQHQDAELHVRPSYLTALCAAAAIAAEQRAAAAEQRRQDRAAAAEQYRQDRARAATLHYLGRQQLDSFEEEIFQHSKLQKLRDPRTKRLSIGLMRHICGFCGAKHFLCKKTGGTIAQPMFSNCCYKGKVQLPPIRRYPPYWTGLLRGNNDAGKHFRSFGPPFNQVLSMASAGADVDTFLFDGHGPRTFCIKGKMRHLIGSLLPMVGQVSKFSCQIYIHQSADAQLDIRMTVYSGMNRVMLRELQSILHSINPFVQQFKSAGEATASGNELELIIRADTQDVDRRRYNLSTAAGEVAALLPGEPIAAPQDIVVQHRSNRLQHIAESNAAYELLHFPLMFPHNETGWHLQIAHLQNPIPTPDLVSAQQQQLEEFSALQHEMQAEQQQQQPGADQPSALQIAKQQMHHLRKLQLSQLEQQHDNGIENRREPDSESDDGLNDGRGREDRCVAADSAICRYITLAILHALAFERLNLWGLQELRGRGQW